MVYLSGRIIPDVRVGRYADAPAYDILWADAGVVEGAAIGGEAVAGKGTSARAKRASRATAAPRKAAPRVKPKAGKPGLAARKSGRAGKSRKKDTE
jgi:hypothetical protein